MAARKLPAWADYGLLPLLNLALAFLVSGLVVVLLGESPLQAVETLVYGAFGYGEAVGYTLYYATNLIFTGLAVAIAFHAGLFNIGGEGQAYLGGLGLGLVGDLSGLAAGDPEHPAGGAGGRAVRRRLGADPGLAAGQARQPRRDHHDHAQLRGRGADDLSDGQRADQAGPERAGEHHLPGHGLDAVAARACSRCSASISAMRRSTCPCVLALLCCVGVWLFVWRSRIGYELRVVGHSEPAAVYGGISPAQPHHPRHDHLRRLAGLMATNEILGGQHRVILGFSGGYGFAGIAVALMGRNHPVGIVLAALLFGALYQGGTELAFEMPRVNKDLVVVIQGLVILFAGALENMFRPQLEALFARPRRHAAVPA